MSTFRTLQISLVHHIWGFFSRNLTLFLFGLNWCGKNATEKDPFVHAVHVGRNRFTQFTSNYNKQHNYIYQGVTINIFELDRRFKSYEQTLESMFYSGKLTKKHDVVCLVNFPASGNCTPDLIQRFDDFLKSSKQRNTKMVPVFTLYDELQLFNPLKENRDKEKNQWLMNFSKTLSSKVQENEIKYMIIEHGYSFELPENRKELLNMCGLNIL